MGRIVLSAVVLARSASEFKKIKPICGRMEQARREAAATPHGQWRPAPCFRLFRERIVRIKELIAIKVFSSIANRRMMAGTLLTVMKGITPQTRRISHVEESS
jgi:hypothetical protein